MTRVRFSASQVGVRALAVVALWVAALAAGGPGLVVAAALGGGVLAALSPEPLGVAVGTGLAALAWVLGRHDVADVRTLAVACCLLVAHGALSVATAVPDRAAVPRALVRGAARRVLALAAVTVLVWVGAGALVAGAPAPGWVGTILALAAVGAVGGILLRE